MKPHRTQSEGGDRKIKGDENFTDPGDRSRMYHRQKRPPGGGASTQVSRRVKELNRITESILEGVLCWVAQEG